jgi:hypothetical protein
MKLKWGNCEILGLGYLNKIKAKYKKTGRDIANCDKFPKM